jgi:glycosyltransferase involved in cell wall biosynthesis
MKTRPRISVIIPTFGRQLGLERALASALDELAADDEVLVVDDGSTPSISLSGRFARDRRLRLIRSDQNRGAAAARNLGIAHAQNELIAFLDSDDRWLPGKISRQFAVLAQNSLEVLTAISCGWIELKDGATTRTRIPRPSRHRQDFFSGSWFAPGATLLVAKAAFELCGAFREDLPRLEDYEWFIRFALAGGRLILPNYVGAEISVGRNAHFSAVCDASATIWDLYGQDERLDKFERRRMAAFLALVQAAGARNDSLWATFAFYISMSFLIRPRVSMHLERWWPNEANSVR